MTRLSLPVGGLASALTVALVVASAVGGAGANALAGASGEGVADATTTTSAADDGVGDRLLVVADAETGERLLAVPVEEGTAVALEYTHSVEKTPVRDVYAVNGTELEMVRMEFQSYGAGLPARADVNITDDGWFAFDPAGSYERVYVTPGDVAGHELTVGDRTYDLVALSAGRSVELRVANRTATMTTTAN